MIKNVIFDMGNVLIRWDPEFIVAHFAETPEGRQVLLDAIFRHPEWAMQDAGDIGEDEMKQHVLERVPEAWRDAAARCADSYEQYVPHISEVLALAAELKANGKHIYILSNAAERFWHYLHAEHDFDIFEGIVVSAMEKLVKPDIRIYRLTAERFGLDVSECVFIDDVQANVDGAKAAGMSAIRFAGDADALRAELHDLGAI